MTSFIRHESCAEAIRFDGTRGSALAVHAKYPFKIARHIDDDTVLMVADGSDMTMASAGEWIVMDYGRDLRVMSDDSFQRAYRPAHLPPVAA